jgi:hypothetical protein
MKQRSKKLDAGRYMPPLKHRVGPAYNVTDSEVAKWLCSQPSVMEYIFQRMNAAGYIVYNPETGTWSGVDYKPLPVAGKEWAFS